MYSKNEVAVSRVIYLNWLPSALRIVACVSIVGALGVSGCSDDEKGTGDGSVKAEEPHDHDDAGSEDAATDVTACADRDDGETCGADKYCIAEQCVFHTCGDGIRTGEEACDDGNEAVGDGCSPSCKIEEKGCGNAIVEDAEECDDGNRIDNDDCTNACTKIECGNMRVDGEEECDDGNTVDDDACSNNCLEVRCRNGRVDPGEQCDDGNQIDDDGCNNKCHVMLCGNGKAEEKEECDDGNMVNDDACSNMCTANKCGNKRIDPGEECDGSLDCDASCKKSAENPCRQCEEMNCRNYQGVDLVAGCYENNPSSDFVQTKPQAGEFSDPCTSLLECTRVNQCSTESRSTDGTCYCGTADPDQCIMTGPAADAPCKDQVFTAAKTNQPDQIAVRMSDLTYPVGWAYYLGLCDLELCKAQCTPWVK